jgi:hypothetical protein
MTTHCMHLAPLGYDPIAFHNASILTILNILAD